MYQTTLKIDGMACSMCEAHVKDVIRKVVPGVKKLSASHGRGEAAFKSETTPDAERLKAAIGETGYRVLDVQTQSVEKKRWFGR